MTSLTTARTAEEIPQQSGTQVRTEIARPDGIIVLTSDTQEKIQSRYRARGHVLIAFRDILVSGDEAEYNKDTQEAFMLGKVRFSQKNVWLNCSRVEFNFGTKTGMFFEASGFTDREFIISGKTIRKTGLDTYTVEDGTATTCPQKLPKWSIESSQTNVRIDGTARMHNAVFKIKGVPVLYLPFLIFPMEKKERSSGFVPFHTGNSTSKGRVVSEGYYQTLGRSADILVYGDYFSLRGLAVGGIFRAKPNQDTRLSLQAYGIRDKLKQGGVQLIFDGESLLKNNWRAVARVNISSNFAFRQAFEDSFRLATTSQERAIAFLTRNHNSLSTNIAFERHEVIFPVRSLVIKKIPSLEFNFLGTPLGRSPFVFSLKTSLDGISRMDNLMESQRLIQRLDLHPRLTLRMPSILGFSLMPSVGVRETYYGAQLSENSSSGIANRSLHRRYVDLNVDLRMPVLERDFSSSWLGSFQHTVEPYVTYRRIHGIRDLEKTIRFDAEDAVADTNEVEYGVINRFFRNNQTKAGTQSRFEFMSFALMQKYYFDPTFGGAFQPGRANAFYPLDTVTGFYQTMTLSNVAPVSAIFRISPQSDIHNDIRMDFDTRLQRWRNGSFSTLWRRT